MKTKNKKKIDIEAKLFMYVLNLKEEKNKQYSPEECEKNIAYIFDTYDEFKEYFQSNGFINIDEDVLKLCIMKMTKKESIIALKALCDYTIKAHILKLEREFSVLATPCDRAFVISKEKANEFKETKVKEEIRQDAERTLQKFKINKLPETHPLRKIKKK